MTWTPKPRPDVDPFALPLDVQQGHLLSRLDGITDVPTLAALTGMEAGRVETLLADLVRMGAIDAAPEAVRSRAEPGMVEAGPDLDSADEPELNEEEAREATARTATHRAHFEQRLHMLPEDARIALAQRAEDPELSALCFDSMPRVIASLLENGRFAQVHARLVAAHHRTAAGLEMLARKTAFAQDAGVRRALLQNPLLPASLYRRLWSPRRLLEQYQVTASRDTPEQTRAQARDVLRASFNQRGADERVELILTTEGRCLASLAGLTLDGHTTALLCRRTYVSTLLIQNIARWSAAPPPLIAHLRKQDAVRRNAQLRQMLERHPNAS